jgi:DNA-3-methyladenine glycosylase II
MEHSPAGDDVAGQSVRTRHEVRVRPPFRLDLTVSALRRLPTNLIDRLTPAGEYVRALESGGRPVIVRARQTAPETLLVEIEGDHGAQSDVLAQLQRILGTDRASHSFARAASAVPWLQPLVERMRGMKPPRYPSLWEALVNAVVFQQVSLSAASAIVRRMTLELGTFVESRGSRLHVFPGAVRVLAERGDTLHRLGLSAAKIATLRRVTDAFESGALDESLLERTSSAEASTHLQRTKGIGPWTASVVLLRGLGRLDVFPPGDSGIARSLRTFAVPDIDLSDLLARLHPEQGMLYYHLLLARLEARGELCRPSLHD